jgi:hypothetical protein
LPETQRKTKADAKLALQAPKDTLSVGENFEVAVVLTTQSRKAGGVDAILTFDPALLQVVAVDKSTVFTEYPQLKFDNSQGKVAVSATTTLEDKQGIAAGEVAKITFTALKTGKGAIEFLFSPGVTTDSNVVAADLPEDILGAVENLQITIK